jgi:hypothetical protein
MRLFMDLSINFDLAARLCSISCAESDPVCSLNQHNVALNDPVCSLP